MSSKMFHHRVRGTLCKIGLRLKITILSLVVAFQGRAFSMEISSNACDQSLVWTVSLRVQEGGIIIIDHIEQSPASGDPCPPYLSGSAVMVCDGQEVTSISLYDVDANAYPQWPFEPFGVPLQSLPIGNYVLNITVCMEL